MATIKPALIVIDMQHFFGDMMTTPLPNIKKLHSLFSKRDWPIIFTQHGHTREDLMPPITNQLVRKLGPANVLRTGTRDWDLIPDIWKLAKDAPIIAKNTYDAFQNTGLHSRLRKAGVGRLVITGVMTDVCCHTTATSAFTKDYETILVSDACGTENEERHRRALKSAEDILIDVLTTDDAIKRLDHE